MSGTQQSLLIVEDDLDLSEMLTAYFGVQGYTIYAAAWGEEAVAIALEMRPDLVVLDIRLPDIDGYEVARQIRSERRTEHTPIIFLTERRERTDKLTGLELGVVDYITKPFDIQELRLRVRNILLRSSSRQSLTNPVTGLPEGVLVDEQLEAMLAAGGDWVLLGILLQGLSGFREMYGFVASDDVLRAISLMITNAVKEVQPDDVPGFVGHLGQDEFVIITSGEQLKKLHQHLVKRIGASLDYFYPVRDRDQLSAETTRLGLAYAPVHASDGAGSDVDSLRQLVLDAIHAT